MALRNILRSLLKNHPQSTAHSHNYNDGIPTGLGENTRDNGTSAANLRIDAQINAESVLDEYPMLPPSTPYDVVIRINSLVALKTSGWAIVLGENARNIDTDTPTSDDARGVVVAIVGSYNRGKTFFINQLCDINLPNGSLIYTEGISMTAGKNQAENIIFVDTAGTDTAIPKDKLSDKKATEALLKEIALHLCSYVIIVVNRLRATDQSYIGQVITHCKSSGSRKNIIIVHNLSDVETMQDIKSIVKTEVEDLFEAKVDSLILSTNQSSSKINFFSSTQDGVGVRHFILAKHGSEAAAMWNRQSIDGIMMILQTATPDRRPIDLINEIVSFVNNRLPQIFNDNTSQEVTSDSNSQPKFQVQKHVRKPCIVLSRRKELVDLEQSPEQLVISPQLLYDDAGYFIGITSPNNGQWVPRYSLYDTSEGIYAIVELAGFKKGSAKVEVVEEAIIIKGVRADVKETLSSPMTLQEKIPIGQFLLEIPLKGYKIDPDETTVERDEGLYKIMCPRKKLKSKVFD